MNFDWLTRSRRTLLLGYAVVSLGWVAGWYSVKVMHYNALEYIGDLFSSLQASRSWLEGFPFLYEFRFGFTLRYHTSFLTAALAPFTVWLGARGLFLSHALLLWLVPLFVLRQLPDSIRMRWALFLLATLYWGPYGAWLFDDIQLGRHAELLFFPLSVLLATALLARRLWAICLAGLPLVFVREDGPVVGCCLHLFALAVQHDSFRGWSVGQIVRRVLPVVAVWFSLFAGLMGILIDQSLGHGVRISSAYHIFGRLSFFEQGYVLSKYLLETVVLLLPFGVLAWKGYGRRLALILGLSGLPLLAVALIGAALYPKATWYGISWAPRMAMLMGYSLGGLVPLLGNRPPEFVPTSTFFFKLSIGLVVSQWLALAIVRQYNGIWFDVQTFQSIRSADPVSPQRQLWELADRIPHRAYVAADYEFYAPFEWHRYVWIDHGRLLYSPVRQPDFIVTAGGSSMPADWQRVPLPGYSLERYGVVRVYRRLGFR